MTALIPNLLTYTIRRHFDVSLAGDEAWVFMHYASIEQMRWLLSLRENAGSAQAIAESA